LSSLSVSTWREKVCSHDFACSRIAATTATPAASAGWVIASTPIRKVAGDRQRDRPEDPRHPAAQRDQGAGAHAGRHPLGVLGLVLLALDADHQARAEADGESEHFTGNVFEHAASVARRARRPATNRTRGLHPRDARQPRS